MTRHASGTRDAPAEPVGPFTLRICGGCGEQVNDGHHMHAGPVTGAVYDVPAVTRAEYERDVVRLAQHAADLRSALEAATRCLQSARLDLTPGMRAGTSTACEKLDAGAAAARAALDADGGRKGSPTS